MFFIGMILGSFFQVVSDRYVRNEQFIYGRSYCPYCHHVLSFFDMIPFISWFLLKRRCRYCHHLISIRYVVSELIGGVLFVVCYLIYGLSFQMIGIYLLFMILYVLSLIDMDMMIVVDEYLLLCLLFIFCLERISFFERLIGCLLISLPMMLINNKKECFGGGDIKMFMVFGFLLGKKIVLVAYIAFLLGGFIACFLVLTKKQKEGYIPFVPFISSGVILTVLFSKEIVNFFF